VHNAQVEHRALFSFKANGQAGGIHAHAPRAHRAYRKHADKPLLFFRLRLLSLFRQSVYLRLQFDGVIAMWRP